MAYIIVITSLKGGRYNLQQYSDNNGVSLSPSHFFFLLFLAAAAAAAAVIFHCRPPSEPKGEKECAAAGDERPRPLSAVSGPVACVAPSSLAVQYVNRLA